MEDFDDLLHEPDESGVLDLSHNAWSVLDEVVWTWDTLLVLNVAYNNIKELPPHLGNLRKLTELNVSHNKLESLPDEISSCVHLTIVCRLLYLIFTKSNVSWRNIFQNFTAKNDPFLYHSCA